MSGLSALDFGIAAAVVLIVAILAFRAPEPPRLDARVRRLDPNKGKTEATRLPLWRAPLAWLGSQSALAALRQRAVDWIWEHSSVGRQKQLLLKQAGLRVQRAYLYFEGGRVLLGLLLAVGTYLTVKNTGLFLKNPALAIVLVIFGLMLGIYLPDVYLKRRTRKRREEFSANWDDAIGLLIICLDAGLSIEVALRRIARELATTAPVLAEELIITVTDLSLLSERRLAYMNLAQRIDLPSVKAVTVALIQAEKQGASIANSLRTIAQANRQNRITLAEEKAAALGPKMTIPMIVFFLPVVFVVIIAPVMLTADF